MRKKEDDWVYQYPSTTVKWKVVPAGANATPYIGDANKLLYQVKNMMTFNELDQYRGIRFLTNGERFVAKIIAKSEFGQDFIEIHVPSEVIPSIIEIDCCEKDINLRRIQQPDRPGYSGLWWESESGTYPQNCVDQPFMFYGDMKMCEVPSEISISDLFIMACIPVHLVAFYVLPDLYGSCPPFEWTLTGPGIFTSQAVTPGGIYGDVGYYGCAEIECHQEITITVKDRCNTATIVHAKSCCEVAAELSIGYTSLLMSCNGQQTFTAVGGCGPYNWAISSGGGSLSASTGSEVIYTAPATNVNCTDNPTITVTDCCGNSASIKLAVNCYTPSGAAITVGEYEVCGDCQPGGGITPNCNWSVQAHWTVTKYNCDGTVYSYCYTNPDCSSWASINLNYYGRCPTSASGLYNCPQESDLNYYLDPMGCNTGQCPCGYPCVSCQCSQGGDCRTAVMKSNGCCPINPLTGLPY